MSAQAKIETWVNADDVHKKIGAFRAEVDAKADEVSSAMENWQTWFTKERDTLREYQKTTRFWGHYPINWPANILLELQTLAKDLEATLAASSDGKVLISAETLRQIASFEGASERQISIYEAYANTSQRLVEAYGELIASANARSEQLRQNNVIADFNAASMQMVDNTPDEESERASPPEIILAGIVLAFTVSCLVWVMS